MIPHAQFATYALMVYTPKMGTTEGTVAYLACVVDTHDLALDYIEAMNKKSLTHFYVPASALQKDGHNGIYAMSQWLKKNPYVDNPNGGYKRTCAVVDVQLIDTYIQAKKDETPGQGGSTETNGTQGTTNPTTVGGGSAGEQQRNPGEVPPAALTDGENDFVIASAGTLGLIGCSDFGRALFKQRVFPFIKYFNVRIGKGRNSTSTVSA
jgi:hypothetical protein